MIHGIGIDLVHVPRFKKALERWGKRMSSRLFTEGELIDCQRKNRMLHLAARFAAKEAFIKSLGDEGANGVGWREIEVFRDERGIPRLRLHGKARDMFESKGLRRCHLSLSHDGDYSMAVVLLEGS